MDLDTLLAEARHDQPLTLREQAALERLIDGHPRVGRRRRVRWVAGLAALSALLLAGGAGAAVAAGVWHPSWYDPDSDWTTEVKTVHRTFTTDGATYHCDVTFSLQSTYDGKGTPEFQKALSYFRSLDPLSVKPDPAAIDEYSHATWVGQGDPPPAPSAPWVNEQVWAVAVFTKVASHLDAIGLDSQRITTPWTEKCDFTR